ncbi:hypothetical protein ACOMHN_060680 [Nucella lapillus]
MSLERYEKSTPSPRKRSAANMGSLLTDASPTKQQCVSQPSPGVSPRQSLASTDPATPSTSRQQVAKRDMLNTFKQFEDSVADPGQLSQSVTTETHKLYCRKVGKRLS